MSAITALAWREVAFCFLLATPGGALGVKVGVSMLALGELRQLEAIAGWITLRGPTLCPRLEDGMAVHEYVSPSAGSRPVHEGVAASAFWPSAQAEGGKEKVWGGDA
mgnify:CR=1 FL=1